jgi:uncharacterized protein
MNGLQDSDLPVIKGVISRFPQVQRAVLFGSRAKGNFKPGSDVDIALYLQGEDITSSLAGILNDETLLPYKFDILNVDSISNQELLDHINRVGIVFYTKT